jgi:DNA invertase Pin-like site-specific DNA recombinase
MRIGYARVSTHDQNIDLQRRALENARCDRVFEDQVSGVAPRRAGLDRLLASITKGDILIVWRLDRLGRSLPHLIEIIQRLSRDGVEFKSLSENIDTTTAGGRLLFHMMGALAEFERSLIQERTRAGLSAARQRGVHVGRRPALSVGQIEHAKLLIQNGENPTIVARSFGVGRSTLYRSLSEQERRSI